VKDRFRVARKGALRDLRDLRNRYEMVVITETQVILRE